MIEIVKRRRVLQNRLKQREHIRMKSSLHNSFSLWSSNSEIVYQVLDSICNASLPKISFCIRFDMETGTGKVLLCPERDFYFEVWSLKFFKCCWYMISMFKNVYVYVISPPLRFDSFLKRWTIIRSTFPQTVFSVTPVAVLPLLIRTSLEDGTHYICSLNLHYFSTFKCKAWLLENT